MDFELRAAKEKLEREQRQRKERATRKLEREKKAKAESSRQREAIEAAQRSRRLDAARAELLDDASTQCSNVGSECERDYSSEFITQEIFKSREALIKWARDVGRRNGFVIVIKTSAAAGHGNKKPRVTLGCERSGCYRDTGKNREVNAEKKMKLTSSKKCGCPFSLMGKNLGTNDDWMLHVVCGVHNHPAGDVLEGHSYAGRLSEEETSLLVDMSKNMVQPKEILVTLKERCDLNVSTMKTIYNARHRFKVAEKAGRTQMQQLFAQLVDHKYIECHRKCDDTETVTDLFWTHPTNLDLLRAFPHVLIMDCTCKTNRYRMPLLEIVGVTSTDLTFSVCFAYLQYEREDNYAWALGILRSVIGEGVLPSVIVTDREMALMKAISMVFPGATHFLCRWHINRNVFAKCKKSFETKEKWDRFIMSWDMLVSSSTEEQYILQLAMLNKEFNTYPEALEYVRCSWLDPYRDKFVAAWTDRSMHFGNTTTNRAGSSHAQLKRQLGSSQGTFESFWMKIHNFLELQRTNIKASFEKSKTIVQHIFKPSEFKELRGNISISALEKILAETKRANSVGIDQDACGCVIRHTHGLPCAHEIAKYIREGRPIPLDCIHPHWCKLDMLATATLKSSSMELDCVPELELIAQRFKEYDSSRKLQLLNKLRELAVPVIKPELKSRTSGPHLKANQQMEESLLVGKGVVFYRVLEAVPYQGYGDKIKLPPSCFTELSDQGALDKGPMYFRLSKIYQDTEASEQQNQKNTHSGVLEFTAPEGSVELPPHVWRNLFPATSQNTPLIEVRYVRLPKGTYAKLQPDGMGFSDIPNHKAVLETSLRQHATLSEGDMVSVSHGDLNYKLQVLELKPSSSVSVLETDIEVDIVGSDSASETTQHVLVPLVLGKAEPGFVEEGKYSYYKFSVDNIISEKIASGDMNVVVKIDVETNGGDTDLYVSRHPVIFPSQHQHEWSSHDVGSKILILSPKDQNLIAGIYSIGVFGFKGLTKYHILVYVEDCSNRRVGEKALSSSSSSAADTVLCQNCKHYIPTNTIALHEAFCSRHNVVCQYEGCGVVLRKEEMANHVHCIKCGRAFQQGEIEKHMKVFHEPLHCLCGAVLEKEEMVQHQSFVCPLRLIPCRFCGDMVQAGSSASDFRDRLRGLSEHESVCGSRTAPCDSCGRSVMLKEMDIHRVAVHQKD